MLMSLLMRVISFTLGGVEFATGYYGRGRWSTPPKKNFPERKPDMLIPFIRSERLNKTLASYYVKYDVYDCLVNTIKGYKDGDEDPYVILQMGADLADELCDSDRNSNGNKLWHLNCDGDNWFIPAKDEQEVEAILKKLLPQSPPPKGEKLNKIQHKIGILNENGELVSISDCYSQKGGGSFDGPCLWTDIYTAKQANYDVGGLEEGSRFVKVMLTIEDFE